MPGRSRASTLHRIVNSHWAEGAGYASMHQGGVGKQEREAGYHTVLDKMRWSRVELRCRPRGTV